MKRSGVLALVVASRFDAGVQEFLRLCVGLRVGGHDVALWEVGPGVGVLSANGALPDEAERYLEALRAEGVVPEAAGVERIRAALGACERMMRIASPERSGEPAVLALDEAGLATVTDAELLSVLASAGQVVRV